MYVRLMCVYVFLAFFFFFFFSSRRRHTRSKRDWSSDVCSSDLHVFLARPQELHRRARNLLGDPHGLRDVVVEGAAPPEAAADDHDLVDLALEIGRASCRERV